MKITVSRFRQYNVLTDDWSYSQRKASDARIEESGWDAVPGTSEEVEEADLDTGDDRGLYPARPFDWDKDRLCPVTNILSERTAFNDDKILFKNDVCGAYTISGTVEAVLRSNRELLVLNGLIQDAVEFVRDMGGKRIFTVEDFIKAGLLPPFSGPDSIKRWNENRRALGLSDTLKGF